MSHIYSLEVDDFLSLVNADKKDAVEIMQEKGFLEPEALYLELLNKKYPSMTAEQKKNCKDTIDASFNRDIYTGLYRRQNGFLVLGLADLYASSVKDKNAYIAEFDIANLGGCGKAIGRENMAPIMKVIAGIYRKNLEKAVAMENKEGKVTGVKYGGDEIRFVATNVSERAVKKALKLAGEQVCAFSREMGLDKIPHAKYPNQDFRKGLGSGAGYAELGKDYTQHELQDFLDVGIELQKIELGRERLKRASLYPEIANISSPMEFKNNKKAQRRILGENGTFSRYLEDSRSSYKKLLSYGKLDKDFPFNSETVSMKEGENPEFIRKKQALKRAKMSNMAPSQKDLLLKAVSYYDQRDVDSGLKTDRDAEKDLQKVIDKKGDKGTLGYLGVLSFSGVSSKIGHNYASCLNKHIAEIVVDEFKKKFGKNAENWLYRDDTTSLKLRIVSPEEKKPDDFSSVFESVQKRIDKEINQLEIKKYLESRGESFDITVLEKIGLKPDSRMEDLKIPQRPDVGGIKMITDVLKLDRSKTASEHLKDIQQKALAKMYFAPDKNIVSRITKIGRD